MKKKRLLSTAIAGTLAAAIIVGGGTFAYLKAQTNTVTNQFNGNNVSVTLTEHKLNADGTSLSNDVLGESETNTYSVIPNTKAAKDPQVTATTTAPAYVFVKIDDTVNTTKTIGSQDAVKFNIADGWTAVTGLTGDEVVYYKLIDKDSGLNNVSVIEGDEVEYQNVTGANTSSGDLKFTAYIIQKDGTASVADAWNAASANP